MSLLAKTRTINAMLQQTGAKIVNFTEMANSLSEVIDANIFILSKEGKVLGLHISRMIENDRLKKMLADLQFPEKYAEELLTISSTSPNLPVEHVLSAIPVESQELFRNALTTVVPIIGNGERLGTLVLNRFHGSFEDDDLILAEYGATVVAMEILRESVEEIEKEARRKAVVQMAINALSFSELEAVEHIFEALEGTEGLLVASQIADRVGITRSVIVNALRKLESAGVIDSRSLGMKGTYIRILNPKFLDELKAVQYK